MIFTFVSEKVVSASAKVRVEIYDTLANIFSIPKSDPLGDACHVCPPSPSTYFFFLANQFW
jgi:hypothetical protein